jgi:hypothetical protein
MFWYSLLPVSTQLVHSSFSFSSFFSFPLFRDPFLLMDRQEKGSGPLSHHRLRGLLKEWISLSSSSSSTKAFSHLVKQISAHNAEIIIFLRSVDDKLLSEDDTSKKKMKSVSLVGQLCMMDEFFSKSLFKAHVECIQRIWGHIPFRDCSKSRLW